MVPCCALVVRTTCVVPVHIIGRDVVSSPLGQQPIDGLVRLSCGVADALWPYFVFFFPAEAPESNCYLYCTSDTLQRNCFEVWTFNLLTDPFGRLIISFNSSLSLDYSTGLIISSLRLDYSKGLIISLLRLDYSIGLIISLLRLDYSIGLINFHCVLIIVYY